MGPFGTIRARAYPAVFEGLVASLIDERTHHAPAALAMDELSEGKDPIIGFGYDWRRDLASEAQRLHEVVRVASEVRRRQTGDGRIDLVAHSMGTQLVRWYLRFGSAPVPGPGEPTPEPTWAGARLVRRALLVGPPNLGEAQTLETLLKGARQHFLLPVYPPALLATFVGAFELLPRPRDGRVVYADDRTPVDLYDADVWETLQWGPFAPDQDEALKNLMPDQPDRAARVERLSVHLSAVLGHVRRFHEALDRPAVPPRGLHLHVFASDTIPTKAVLLVDRASGEISWAPPEPGDGTVTRRSGLGQLRADVEAFPTVAAHSVHFLASDHLGIVADTDFIDHALYLLLEAPVHPPSPE